MNKQQPKKKPCSTKETSGIDGGALCIKCGFRNDEHVEIKEYKCLSCPNIITEGDYCKECSDTPDGRTQQMKDKSCKTCRWHSLSDPELPMVCLHYGSCGDKKNLIHWEPILNQQDSSDVNETDFVDIESSSDENVIECAFKPFENLERSYIDRCDKSGPVIDLHPEGNRLYYYDVERALYHTKNNVEKAYKKAQDEIEELKEIISIQKEDLENTRVFLSSAKSRIKELLQEIKK